MVSGGVVVSGGSSGAPAKVQPTIRVTIKITAVTVRMVFRGRFIRSLIRSRMDPAEPVMVVAVISRSLMGAEQVRPMRVRQ